MFRHAKSAIILAAFAFSPLAQAEWSKKVISRKAFDGQTFQDPNNQFSIRIDLLKERAGDRWVFSNCSDLDGENCTVFNDLSLTGHLELIRNNQKNRREVADFNGVIQDRIGPGVGGAAGAVIGIVIGNYVNRPLAPLFTAAGLAVGWWYQDPIRSGVNGLYGHYLLDANGLSEEESELVDVTLGSILKSGSTARLTTNLNIPELISLLNTAINSVKEAKAASPAPPPAPKSE